MSNRPTRREMIRAGIAGAGLGLMAGVPSRLFAADEIRGDQVVPFLDPQPIDPKRPMLKWQDLTDWITPPQQFFDVSHYGAAKLNEDSWRLRVEGLVSKPLELSLAQLRERPKRDVIATLECSGNGAGPGFMGAIGNARWTGTPLKALLAECGVMPQAVEVAFWGADKGKEKIRDHEYEQNFAR